MISATRAHDLIATQQQIAKLVHEPKPARPKPNALSLRVLGEGVTISVAEVSEEAAAPSIRRHWAGDGHRLHFVPIVLLVRKCTYA